MNKSDQIVMAGLARPARRCRLLPLLLGSVLWAVVSFGCVTLNYVTDVNHTAAGHGATVSLDVEINQGVYDALLEIEPTLGEVVAENQAEAGWAVEARQQGRLALIRRQFDSLAELAEVPQFLAGEDGDVSDSFVQAIAVTTQEVDENTVEYLFTATVVIEARDMEVASNDSGEDVPLSVEEMFADYPRVLAALEDAGPAQIIIQTYLPGTMVEQSVNGSPDSNFSEVIGGRVRWVFTEDQPGTYELRAMSRGPSRALMEEAIFAALRDRPNVQYFLDLFDGEELLLGLAAWDAAETLVEVRAALGKDLEATTYSSSEVVLLEAAFLAQFCDSEGLATSCLMPATHRALPLIKRLAVQAGDDDVEGLVIEQIVDELVTYDLNQLVAR